MESRWRQPTRMTFAACFPLLPGTTSFVVELPTGRLSAAGVARYAAAVRTLSRS